MKELQVKNDGTASDVSAILVDTGTTIPGTITTLQTDATAIKASTGQFTRNASVDCTGATPITVFTVTGDVLLKVYAVVKTALTTSDAITAELGVSGATNVLIAQVADATGLAIGEIWHDAAPDTSRELSSVASEWIMSAGQDVILTTTGTVTAGEISFYCFWTPLSSDGAVA